jgi:hypothetical protein
MKEKEIMLVCKEYGCTQEGLKNLKFVMFLTRILISLAWQDTPIQTTVLVGEECLSLPQTSFFNFLNS